MKATSQTTRQKVFEIIRDGKPRFLIDIADSLGISHQLTGYALRELHTAGEIHIAAWHYPENGGGKAMKIWGAGKGVDAVKREALSREEMNRLYRERMRTADRKLERENLKSFVPFRHPLDEVFFGPWTQPVQVSTVPRRTVEGWSA